MPKPFNPFAWLQIFMGGEQDEALNAAAKAIEEMLGIDAAIRTARELYLKDPSVANQNLRRMLCDYQYVLKTQHSMELVRQRANLKGL